MLKHDTLKLLLPNDSEAWSLSSEGSFKIFKGCFKHSFKDSADSFKDSFKGSFKGFL